MASTYLTKSISSTGSQTKGTLSVWLKKSDTTNEQAVLNHFTDSNNFLRLRFNANTMVINATAKVSGTNYYITTNAVFRDTSAWYHIVWKIDTTQATDTDRYKLYINGSLQTFSASSLPTQNLNLTMNTSGQTIKIGASEATETSFFGGCMTHYHWTDGYAYDASDFGQTDSTSGIWKPKTAPSVTYGTNGFFLKFANSASLGLDSSGNTNNFTVSGTGTQTQDTPSNNFSVINSSFQPDPTNGTFSTTNGGLSFTTNFTSTAIMGVSTLGVSSGKWYAEFKLTGESGSGEALCGIGYDIYDNATSSMGSEESFFWSVCSNGDTKFGGSAKGANAWSTTYTTNDIISVAMDLDNNRVYFAKNGQYANGSGSWNQAFTASPAYLSITADKTYFFMAGDKSTSTNASWTCNFGNGYFATTAVASSNSDSAELGLFEYSVPSGYYALCTKNIKNYG